TFGSKPARLHASTTIRLIAKPDSNRMKGICFKSVRSIDFFLAANSRGTSTIKGSSFTLCHSSPSATGMIEAAKSISPGGQNFLQAVDTIFNESNLNTRVALPIYCQQRREQ